MRKLIVNTKEILSKLQLACFGVVNLEKIAHGHLKQMLFPTTDLAACVKKIHDNLHALEKLELDCSLLEKIIYSAILLIELNTWHRVFFKKLLIKELQSIQRAMGQSKIILAKSFNTEMSIIDRLKMLNKVVKQDKPLPKELLTFDYHTLITKAHIGFQKFIAISGRIFTKL